MFLKTRTSRIVRHRRNIVARRKAPHKINMLTLYGLIVASVILTVSAIRQYGSSIQPPISMASNSENVTPEATREQKDAIKIYLLNKQKERDDIKRYIFTIFKNENPELAYAISLAEAGVYNQDLKEWVYRDYPIINHSSVEHSVCIFQINLYNKNHKIHADRIPGGTMAEKEEWLADPYNCTLYTYWVYKESGWYPWTTYDNGRYLQHYGK